MYYSNINLKNGIKGDDMPLSKITRDGNKYLYFKVNGSRRLYLGTNKKPKKEKIEEAVHFLNEKILKYEIQKQELERYLPEKIEDSDIHYKLVVFDLDGVLFEKPWHDTNSDRTAVSTWDILFQEIQHYKVHEDYRQNYIDGFFKSYREWTEAACNFLKNFGLKRDLFERIINQRQYVPGAEDVFKTLREKNVKTAVISGSFDALAQRAKRELWISYAYAHCKLNFDRNNLLRSWKIDRTDYEDKPDVIRKIAGDNSIDLEECAYIGDDVNDIEAFKIVGLRIAFNAPKASVRQSADIVIESRNLKSILPHLYVEKAHL